MRLRLGLGTGRSMFRPGWRQKKLGLRRLWMGKRSERQTCRERQNKVACPTRRRPSARK